MITHLNMRTFIHDFAKLVSHQSDKIALLDSEGREFTYLALSKQIENAHAWLKDKGLQPGETIIALMPNAIETIILFLACLQGGYTYAPLPCTATLSEVMRWKSLTRARFCFFSNALTTQFKQQLSELDWKATSLAIGEKGMPWPIDRSAQAVGGGRLIMASSGSTGEPKAMLLDGDRLWSAGYAFLRFHRITEGKIRIWNYLPMSYLGGLFNLTLIPLAAGGTIFVDEAFSGKTFLVFWATVERFKINSLWLVPTILRGLLTLFKRTGQVITRPEIDYCFLGTAPVSLEEKQLFAQVFGIQPLENYGLSETTFISSEQQQQIALRKEGTVGARMPDVDIKLVAVVDKTPEAEQIWVKTPFLMLGYLDPNGGVLQEVDSDGYFATGDFGRIIDGQLQLLGRGRDIIKKGGILVALREIELVAESYPEVSEASAVKIEHNFYGESCILFIRADEPISSAEELISGVEKWLHDNLVRHKWPEKIIYCNDFPRTASGKIQKHILVARSAAHAE